MHRDCFISGGRWVCSRHFCTSSAVSMHTSDTRHCRLAMLKEASYWRFSFRITGYYRCGLYTLHSVPSINPVIGMSHGAVKQHDSTEPQFRILLVAGMHKQWLLPQVCGFHGVYHTC